MEERATGNRCRLASAATPDPPWRSTGTLVHGGNRSPPRRVRGRWCASRAGGKPGRLRDSEASFLTGPSGDLGLEGGTEHSRLVRLALPSRRGRAAAAHGRNRGMAATLGPIHHTQLWVPGIEARSLPPGALGRKWEEMTAGEQGTGTRVAPRALLGFGLPRASRTRTSLGSCREIKGESTPRITRALFRGPACGGVGEPWNLCCALR